MIKRSATASERESPYRNQRKKIAIPLSFPRAALVGLVEKRYNSSSDHLFPHDSRKIMSSPLPFMFYGVLPMRHPFPANVVLAAVFHRIFPVLMVIGAAIYSAFCVPAIQAQDAPASQDIALKKSEKEAEDPYLRITRNEKKAPSALETAIIHYEGRTEDGEILRVDLVAAIHIGDEEYFEELNERFEDYEVVLYELVAPKGTRLTPEMATNRNGNPVSGLQNFLSETLKLEHQLAQIDYMAENFVHADMDPEELLRRMQERKDLTNILLRSFALSMGKQESSGAEGRLLAALFQDDPSLSLKRMFAEEMETSLADSIWVIEGDKGSSLIADRNAAAFEILKEQIAKGNRHIAIYYGAAHMPDFAERLEGELDLNRTGTDWVVAWDITSDGSAREESPSED